MPHPESDPRFYDSLTVRGSGEFNGYTWTLRCEVRPDGVYDYLYIHDAIGHTGGQGGGGHFEPGAEVLQDRASGHIAALSQMVAGQGLAHQDQRLQPNAVHGLVSGPVSSVMVELSDGSSQRAVTLPHVDDDNLQSFVLVFPSGLWATALVALDLEGNEAERSPWEEPMLP